MPLILISKLDFASGRIFLHALVLVCLCTTKLSAVTYDMQTLDTISGNGASLVLDTLGRPHISYRSFSSDLRYQFWNGSAWQKSVVVNSGVSHWDTSIALDAAQAPHISYVTTQPFALRHAQQTPAGWTTDAVASLTGFNEVSHRADIVAGESGNMHIIYNDGETALKEAIGSAGSWVTRIILATSVGAFAAATRDGGDIRIALGNNFDLWTGSAPLGGTWSAQAIATQPLPWDIDVAIDRLGQPAISFRDIHTGNKAVWLARFDGASWNLDVIAPFSTSFGTSLAFTGDNQPVVSFYSRRPGLGGCVPCLRRRLGKLETRRHRNGSVRWLECRPGN